jgi:hypothetical protein
MKRLLSGVLLAAVLPVAACNQPSQPTTPPPNPTPPTQPDKPKVDIQAPGVDIKSKNGETTVRTPGADVEVNKK